MTRVCLLCLAFLFVLIPQVKAAGFEQKSIRNIDFDKGTVEAKVEGKWNTYRAVNFPEKVVKWNFGRRIAALEDSLTNPQALRSLIGPHSGIVASHGAQREDSLFSVNAAVKGMGFLPKKDKIKTIMAEMRVLKNEPRTKKVEYLINLYKRGREVFDLDKQISIELYTDANFKTHTFMNCMEDPGVSIVFLDYPSYEARAISYLLDPNNPNLSSYERDIVDYNNLVHSFFHGEFPRMYIAVVYFIVEAFDNTPGTPEGRGRKIETP